MMQIWQGDMKEAVNKVRAVRRIPGNAADDLSQLDVTKGMIKHLPLEMVEIDHWMSSDSPEKHGMVQ
jgi:hypothetical protein